MERKTMRDVCSSFFQCARMQNKDRKQVMTFSICNSPGNDQHCMMIRALKTGFIVGLPSVVKRTTVNLSFTKS